MALLLYGLEPVTPPYANVFSLPVHRATPYADIFRPFGALKNLCSKIADQNTWF